MENDMSDGQLLRYSRQIMLPQLDIAGQNRLLQSRVLIVGVGGLGSPVALYLAACGVGTLVLTDPDHVELTNLQRQIVHGMDTLDTMKVHSAYERLKVINPDIQIITLPEALSDGALKEQVTQADLVLDCTDQLAVRFRINHTCIQTKTPWVSAAAIRWEGQIAVFQPAQAESPCYQCFYGDIHAVPETCSDKGVIGPLLGVLGSMQALEAIKILTGVGETLTGRVLLFDGLHMEWTPIKLPKRADCSACAELSRTTPC